MASGLTLELRGQEPEHYNLHTLPNRQSYEIAEMARILEEKDFAARDRLLDHSLLVARLLEEARQSAGITFQCDMEDEASEEEQE